METPTNSVRRGSWCLEDKLSSRVTTLSQTLVIWLVPCFQASSPPSLSVLNPIFHPHWTTLHFPIPHPRCLLHAFPSAPAKDFLSRPQNEMVHLIHFPYLICIKSLTPTHHLLLLASPHLPNLAKICLTCTPLQACVLIALITSMVLLWEKKKKVCIPH